MSLLKKKFPNRIISDNGFEVRIETRGTILYFEGNKQIKANSGFLVDDEGIALYRTSLKKWEKPNDKEIILDTKIQQIETNIKDALFFVGVKLTII